MQAKFLWKRVPPGLKANQSELSKLWCLAQCFIQRKYSDAFELANQMKASNHMFTSPELDQLVDSLIEKSKERLFDLIILAYSSISIKDMADLLRMSAEDTVKIALGQAWELDETRMFLMPRKRRNLFHLCIICSTQI